MPPPEAAPANPAVANAVMTPAPDAAAPIAAPQRLKVSEMRKRINAGEMPEMAYDPAARAPVADNAPRTLDAPLFAEEYAEGELAEPASIEPYVDDSIDAEVVEPAEYARIRAMFDAPELAEPLLDKIVTATLPDGKPWQVSVRNCIKGFLREEDYSRKNAELAAERNAVRTARAGLEKLLGQMDTTDGFLYAMRVLQKWGTEPVYSSGQLVRPGTGFMGACFAVGDQLAQEMTLREKNPDAYRQLMQRRETEQRLFAAEQRALQAENAAQQAANQQQPGPDQAQQRTMNQLEQLMPRALQVAGLEALMKGSEAFKLEWSVNSEKLFGLHWQHLLPTLSPEQLESGPSMDFVQMVVNATVQSCQKRAAEIGRPVANTNVPPPTQGLTGAPTRQGQPGSNGAPKRAKVGDMGKLLGTFR